MYKELYFDTDHKITEINTVPVDASNDPHWEFPLHVHNDNLELSLITDGSADVFCGNGIYHLTKGDIIIKNKGVLHGEKSIPDYPVVQLCLSLSGIHFFNQDHNVLLPDLRSPVIHLNENYPLVHEMMKYIFKHNQGMASSPLVFAMIDQLLILLHEEIISANHILLPKDKPVQTIMDVIAYLDTHYMEKISLNDLAEKHYISPYYLSRLFKESTNFTINQYIINRRMGEAQRLLIFGQFSIKEIANLCGYTDLQYFYKTFKKYTGLTPVEFQGKYL